MQNNKKMKSTMKRTLTLFIVLLFVPLIASSAYGEVKDWRNIENAISQIPSEGYCDQPYAVINKKGEWVIVMTTGAGEEGSQGQHVSLPSPRIGARPGARFLTSSRPTDRRLRG